MCEFVKTFVCDSCDRVQPIAMLASEDRSNRFPVRECKDCDDSYDGPPEPEIDYPFAANH